MGFRSLKRRRAVRGSRSSDPAPPPAGERLRSRSLPALAACLLVLAPAGLGAPGPAAAQSGPDGRVEEARRLRDRGELRGAAERLRAFLADHPEDASALRMLAGVLEQSGDGGGALEALERAVRVRPGDPLLRLDYGRMLVDRNAVGPAREALRSVADDPGVPPRIRADAHVQLGRAALRTDEIDAAEGLLRRALELEARHAEALRLLRAVHRDRSSSIRSRGSVADDDQPVGRAGAEVRGEWRIRPWLEAGVLGGTERLTSPGLGETVDRAGGGIRARWEPLNLAAAVRGAGYRRSAVAGTGWSAGGSIEVTGPESVALRLEADRRPYLRTSASLEDPIDVWSIGGTVERPASDGWSGLLSYREDRFGEGDRIRETVARFLVPVTTTPAGRVRLGYRFHAADADENAFRPLEVGGGAGDRLEGRYDPVYTPEGLRSHGLLMGLTYGGEGRFRLTGEAGWGFHAREERPVLYPAVPGAPEAGTDRQFHRRSFTPWHLTGRLELPVLPAMVVAVRAGYEKSAFRARSYLGVGWAYYLIPADLR